ncbi:MAG: hypothetical protein ACEQSH_00215 [Bacteroidia bacterium]
MTHHTQEITMGLTWNIDGGAQVVHIGDHEGSVTVPFADMRRLVDILPPAALPRDASLTDLVITTAKSAPPKPPRFTSLSGIEGEMFALDDAGRVWRWNGNKMVLCRCEAVSEDSKP